MQRFYRSSFYAGDLIYYNVKYRETDIYAGSDTNLQKECLSAVHELRGKLDRYIENRPVFATSLVPIKIEETADKAIKLMAQAADTAGVGPMAAVAGAFNEAIYERIKTLTENVILENGGDLLLAGEKARTVSIYGGENKLKDKLRIRVEPEGEAISVCTSSGTLGHSLSFGKSDSVTIISRSCCVADAAATACGNIVKTPEDIQAALDFAISLKGVEGVVITIGDKLGACGNIKFV